MTDMKENETEDERIERIVEKIVKKKLLNYDRSVEDRFNVIVWALGFIVTVILILDNPALDLNFFEISWVAFWVGTFAALYISFFQWLLKKKDYHRIY